MTDLELALTHPSYRPLPGHCVIQFDDPPTMSGLIHIPETAQHTAQLINRDKCWTGRVLGMTPRRCNWRHICRKGSTEPVNSYYDCPACVENPVQRETFKVGDRVVVMLGVGDLDRKVVLALNTRVYAVISPTQDKPIDSLPYCGILEPVYLS